MTTGRRAAVLGSPIAHSLSPVLHRAAYAAMGLVGWRYDAIEVGDADGLRELVASCDDSWAGLSLTMPLKRLVQPLLSEQSEVARATGSVNTVLFTAEGLVGDNTDVEGLVHALGESGVVGAERAVVLGGGATAASAVAALVRLGCANPQVVVRSVDRAAAVAATGDALGATVRLRPWDDAPAALAQADVVVTTVPVSGHAAVVAAIDAAAARPGLLLDVTYDPWPTPAAARWTAGGGRAVGGFGMLLHQAAAQVRLMTGREPDVEAMRAAGRAALAQDGDQPGR
ncbi:MAG: shikimate dehydrogenase [Angustibacter sp.]